MVTNSFRSLFGIKHSYETGNFTKLCTCNIWVLQTHVESTQLSRELSHHIKDTWLSPSEELLILRSVFGVWCRSIRTTVCFFLIPNPSSPLLCSFHLLSSIQAISATSVPQKYQSSSTNSPTPHLPGAVATVYRKNKCINQCLLNGSGMKRVTHQIFISSLLKYFLQAYNRKR